jgi:purine-cytosine permease-like protein
VYQANSLSAITQYSLIGLGVGRPDWFLVLFVFLSTIIANAFYVYAYTLSVSEIFNLKRSYLFISSMVFVLFVVDNIVLKNIQSSLSFMHNYVSFLALFVGISMPILVKCLAGKKSGGVIKGKHRNKLVYYKERCAI